MQIHEMKKRVLIYARVVNSVINHTTFTELDSNRVIFHFINEDYPTSWKSLYDALLKIDKFPTMTPEQISIWFDMHEVE